MGRSAQIAVNEVVKTIYGIHGIDIVDQTAQVDPNTGNSIQNRYYIFIQCRKIGLKRNRK